MVRLAELTIYNNNDEELDKDYAIVISPHREIKEREVRRICSRLFEDKITDIKWDNYAEQWTFILGDEYNAQLELIEYPLVSL